MLLVNYTWETKSLDQIYGPLQGNAKEFKPPAFALPYTRDVIWVSEDVQSSWIMERKRQETDAGVVIWKPRDNMLIIKMH